MKGWYKHSRVITSHNILTNTKHPHQQGGVGIIVSGDLALRANEITADKAKMGRWSSTLLRGQQHHNLRIVSVYVPHIPKGADHGNLTVYSQQQAALLRIKRYSSVIVAFWNDFWRQLDIWIEKGEQILIGGDWNENVYCEKLLEKFRTRNLLPVITTKHTGPAPPTYNKGSYPIDEFFASASLEIKNCGYLEHGTNTGDHCPIWVEMDKAKVLGTNPPPIPKQQARRLQPNDPNVVKKYNHILEQEFEKNNVYQRALNLYNAFSKELTPAQSREYEKLDKIRSKSMKKAERKCRHLHMGAVPWSPVIQHARDSLQYGKLTLRRKLGRNVSARYLIRLSKKTDLYYEGWTIEQLKPEVYRLVQVYKKLKKNAHSLRQTFLEYLASALEKEGQGKKSKIVANLIKIEEQRRLYRRLKPISRKFADNLSTTSVVKTQQDGSQIEISQKEEMEEAIIQENISKYHQCESTCPFLKPPLRNLFGPYGDSISSDQVINGNFIPPENTDEMTKAYLQACQSTAPPTQLKRNVDEFKSSWKKMKANKGTHDLHFGHFIASCKHEHNLLVHYIMAEIPFRTGFAPRRWKAATNVMILKKAGLFDITKLRTLCLFQADFNHNNKHLGRTMMNHALKHQQIAKEQYSVTGKKSISHALNKTLLFDNARFQRACLSLTSCDLKSCYDRIAHTPALLAARSMGIEPEPLISLFSTLQDVQYYTRTVYGVSESFFGGNHEKYNCKPQGAGQGNGVAPQLWAVVSTKMFAILHKLNLSNLIKIPIEGTSMYIIGFAYVDDSDLFAWDPNDVDATMEQMQTIVDKWELAAKVTGGAIAPQKCWWYLVRFNWDDDGNWSYIQGNDDYTIRAKDANNITHTMKYLKPGTAQEMLGVYIAPTGSNTAQVSFLKDRARYFADAIRTSNIYASESWIALTTMAMKSIEYCLPATTLTEDECKEIMWILIESFLPKSGINRFIKRDVLYALPQSQGLGLRNIYYTQGIWHVIELIEHTWKKSVTGHFLQVSLDSLRLELGLGHNLLNADYKHISTALKPTNSWICNTWEFMHAHSITSSVDATAIPRMRENDQPLMELVLASSISKADMQVVNKCRIYLQVFNIADMVTGCGSQLTLHAWNCVRDDRVLQFNYTWPQSPAPSQKMKRIWRQALRILLCKNREMFLDKPLGKWKHCPPYWKWFQDEEGNLYSKHHDGNMHKHMRIGRSSRRQSFDKESTQVSASLDSLYPTTIITTENGIRPTGYKSRESVPPLITSKVATYHQWLHYNKESYQSNDALLEALNSGTATAVSDGSYHPEAKLGSAAWVFVDKHFDKIIKGQSISPGSRSLQSAYRSEILGLLALLDYITTTFRTISSSAVLTIYSDNERALDVVANWTCDRLTPKQKHADLISALLKVRDSLGIKIQVQHVKAHQDDSIPYEQLSLPAKLNVDMDADTKALIQVMMTCPDVCANKEPHPSSFSLCWWKSQPIYHDLDHELYYHITHDKMIQYWIEKERITSTTLPLIDFNALRDAAKSLTLPRQRFLAKWVAEYLPTGKNMKRWSLRHDGACPFCTQSDETTSHMVQCTTAESCTIWDEALNSFISKTFGAHMCWYVQFAIHSELHAWRYSIPPPDISIYPTLLQPAITEQRQIGWKQFMEGLLSTKWRSYIDFQYQQQGEGRSSTKFLSSIIRGLWACLFQIWEGRNGQLHKTERIKDMEGLPLLKEAIRKEWEIGLGHLPASEFSHHLTLPVSKILDKSEEALKLWFLTIRQGRIVFDQGNLLHDDFYESKALQQWIGLSYTLHNDDVASRLEEAIATEVQIGLGNLPTTQFKSLFSTTTTTNITASMSLQKHWLRTVRQGRTLYDKDNLIKDEFSQVTLYQQWLENDT